VDFGENLKPTVHDVFSFIKDIFHQIISFEFAVIEVAQDVVLSRNFPFLTEQ
jgi:hypothetical protein